MRRKSKTVGKTDGNLALTNEPRLHPHIRKLAPTLRLVQAIRGTGDLVKKPFFTVRQLLLAIGLSITLCLLWFLVVSLLYRMIRATMAVP